MGSGCVGETGRSLSPNCAVGDRVHVAGSPGVLTPRETQECLVLSCFQPKGTSLGVREACRKESTVVWVGLPSNSGFLPPPLPLIRGNPRCLNWRPFLCVEYQGIPCLLSRKFSPFPVVRCGGGASPKSVQTYAFVLRHPFLLVSTFFCKQPIPFFAPFSFSLPPSLLLPPHDLCSLFLCDVAHSLYSSCSVAGRLRSDIASPLPRRRLLGRRIAPFLPAPPPLPSLPEIR